MSGSLIYRDPRWPALRRAAIVRAGGKCQIGLPGCKGRANSADHIVELEDGGAAFDLANLQASCVSCNSAKGNMRRGQRKHGRARSAVRSW